MLSDKYFTFQRLDAIPYKDARDAFVKYLKDNQGITPNSYMEVCSFVSYLYFESENLETLNSYLRQKIIELSLLKRTGDVYKYTNKDLASIFHKYLIDNLDNKPKIRNHINFIKQSVWETYDERESDYKEYPHTYPKKSDVLFLKENYKWINRNFAIFKRVDDNKIISLLQHKVKNIPKVLGGNVRCFKDEYRKVWREVIVDNTLGEKEQESLFIMSGVINNVKAYKLKQLINKRNEEL